MLLLISLLPLLRSVLFDTCLFDCFVVEAPIELAPTAVFHFLALVAISMTRRFVHKVTIKLLHVHAYTV